MSYGVKDLKKGDIFFASDARVVCTYLATEDARFTENINKKRKFNKRLKGMVNGYECNILLIDFDGEPELSTKVEKEYELDGECKNFTFVVNLNSFYKKQFKKEKK